MIDPFQNIKIATGFLETQSQFEVVGPSLGVIDSKSFAPSNCDGVSGNPMIFLMCFANNFANQSQCLIGLQRFSQTHHVNFVVL